jgi:carbonic anhydrase
MPFTRPESLDAAVSRLVDGNRRFVEERPQTGVQSALRIELAAGQMPFAVVLGCSDSRVPVETVFDQPPGNLFVVRIAGNVVNDDSLGSVEYAVDVLNSMLVVVLGHSTCGAIQAAVQHVEAGTTFKGHIQHLVDAVTPAALATKGTDGDWIHNAVAENVRATTRALRERSTILAAAVDNGSVRIVGAIYDLPTGIVEFL